MILLFRTGVAAALTFAGAGVWLTSFEYVEDLSAFRGGASCSERYEGSSCNQFSTPQSGQKCIACNTGGVDLDCKDYSNEFNCIACNPGGSANCGGNTLQGDPEFDITTEPPTFIECHNWRSVGPCSKTYDNATTAQCQPGQTC